MNKLCTVLAFIALGAASLSATAISYNSSFVTDDQIQTFLVSLAANSTVTFETLSYGGGTNSQNNVIAPGGFDPRLTWFASDGTEIGSDNGGHCGVTATYLGACNDAYFKGFLSAGTYTLVLTEDGNDPNGNFSDGFSEAGAGDFTASGSCSVFCDSLSGNALSGNYDVEVVQQSIAAPGTPEPSTFLLSGSILLLLVMGVRRCRQQ